MCRIFGASFGDTPEDLDDRTIAMTMFHRLVGGGPDAYGWMQSDGEQVSLHKFVGRADALYATQDVLDNMTPRSRFLVGHTRWATHGSPHFNPNNHPIHHDNIVGVHNGVLSNHDAILKQTGRQDPKSEVDSEAIFAAVNRWGHKNGLTKIDGNMVAVYTDLRKPHLLYLARSYGRELVMAWSDRGNLFFASERQALLALQPEINLVRWSNLSHFRHLTVRAGAIITRQTYDNFALTQYKMRQAETKAWTKATTPAKKDGKSKPKASVRAPKSYDGGIKGITDHFDGESHKARRAKRQARIAELEAELEINKNHQDVAIHDTTLGDLIEVDGAYFTPDELAWMKGEIGRP